MEFKVNEVQIPAAITFNYEELKHELQEKANFYASIVYDDAEIKKAKADKANLNKLKKALNDERIRQEKEYMKPFTEFKAQVNEIISIIDEPIAAIDEQVKAYEEKQKAEKMEKIKEFWESTEHPDWLDCRQIFDSKWLNASVSMKSVQEAITARLIQIEADIATIGSLPEFSFEAMLVYKHTLDLNHSIAEGHRLADIQKRKAEAEAAAAERKAEAEKAAAAEPPEESVPCTPDPPIHVPERQWVKFQVKATSEEAMELSAYLKSRNIPVKKFVEKEETGYWV